MAIFAAAWNITKANEGGYSLTPGDLGGETYRGISRRFNPGWQGWPQIDALKNRAPIKHNFTSLDLDQAAANFYQANYWRPILAELIARQDIANVIFDQAVIGGVNRTNDMVKHLLNSRFGGAFILNGLPQLKEIEMINAVNANDFLSAFNSYRRKFFYFSAGKLYKFDPLYNLLKRYNKTSEAKKQQNYKFLAAWIKRSDKYATSERQLNEILTAATFAGFGLWLENKLS